MDVPAGTTLVPLQDVPLASSRLPSLAELGLDVYMEDDGEGGARHGSMSLPPLSRDSNRVRQGTFSPRSADCGEGSSNARHDHYRGSSTSTSPTSPLHFSRIPSPPPLPAFQDHNYPHHYRRPEHQHPSPPRRNGGPLPPEGNPYPHPKHCACQWCATSRPTPPTTPEYNGQLNLTPPGYPPPPTTPTDMTEPIRLNRPQLVESLRRDLGLPPEMPLSLNSIQDPGPDYRPVFSYMLLVQVALLESPMQKLTLQGIYEALEARFAWCRGNSTWKESIRHMLTLRAEFEHISREEAACFPGKGSFWRLTGLVGLTRPRKRGPRGGDTIHSSPPSSMSAATTTTTQKRNSSRGSTGRRRAEPSPARGGDHPSFLPPPPSSSSSSSSSTSFFQPPPPSSSSSLSSSPGRTGKYRVIRPAPPHSPTSPTDSEMVVDDPHG